MHRQTARAVLLGLATLVTAGTTATPAPARSVGRAFAAPEIVIVYGDPLPEPRIIADWEENHRLLLSVAGAPSPSPLGLPPAPLAGRPALRLALFWGISWRATAQSPERLRALRPEQANQQGLFYPATADAPAHLAVGSIAGAVSDSGLAVLRRHGVPVRLPVR
jgi:hypothetical protein